MARIVAIVSPIFSGPPLWYVCHILGAIDNVTAFPFTQPALAVLVRESYAKSSGCMIIYGSTWREKRSTAAFVHLQRAARMAMTAVVFFQR